MMCQGCWEQMHVPIFIRGPFSIIFRPFGIKKSQMHPNICTICESMFTKVKKQKQIEIYTTILFADIREYTQLSQNIDVSSINGLLHRFYDLCSKSVWENDGIINKFLGDGVFAIFNFPLERQNHVQNAVSAAVQLLKHCLTLKAEIGLGDEHSIGVGVGIHTGKCNMGEVGNSYKDFTAIGHVVNLAARLQGAANPGEILMTEDVFKFIEDDFPNLPSKMLTLKNIDAPVKSYIIDRNAIVGYATPYTQIELKTK